MNPLFQNNSFGLNNTQNNILAEYQNFSSNPNAYIQQKMQSNPNIASVMNMINNGANPQKMFYELCKQRGINPEQFLKQFNFK